MRAVRVKGVDFTHLLMSKKIISKVNAKQINSFSEKDGGIKSYFIHIVRACRVAFDIYFPLHNMYIA